MARCWLYRLHDGSMVVDCQSDLVDHLGTRLVAPLLDPALVPNALPRLHPVLTVGGERLLMATHLAAAIPASELGQAMGSLESERYIILNALDFLISGV